jgi:hypothetical protein
MRHFALALAARVGRPRLVNGFVVLGVSIAAFEDHPTFDASLRRLSSSITEAPSSIPNE